MKSTGIVRKIDPLGRVVLPKELRKSLSIESQDPLEIFVDKDQIILRKYQAQKACLITGKVSEDNLVLENGKVILSREGLDILSKELKRMGMNV
ncbi:AbrB/MazE/SpoVT family DNA-binding domain-containing protein [Priestia filamentosa]|uniref:AbrB/MazE/SpoVT family DNA-binding domain-containing protein n=1 Tax=Priestia filamentosa TaxID=1402861 RepID=UPI00397A1057